MEEDKHLLKFKSIIEQDLAEDLRLLELNRRRRLEIEARIERSKRALFKIEEQLKKHQEEEE